MGQEIERKFKVTGTDYRRGNRSVRYQQGYISTSESRSVRVRRAGDKGFITIKGGKGIVRSEYEYEIPLQDALEMLEQLCAHPLIEKERYLVPGKYGVWEVDEFLGENAGLVIAEVELKHIDDVIDTPSWLGEEVTYDERYLNVNLQKMPYSKWNQ